MPISVTYPFALATGSLGYFEPTATVVEALKSNVRSLLSTNWGERVMHANFGCNFRQFLFEEKTDNLRARVGERVSSQLNKWLPFLSIDGIFVTFSEDDPSIPDPGFGVRVELSYGNIPVDVFLSFPVT